MKTSFMSNLAMSKAQMLTVSRGQNEIQKLNTEIVTGRHADIGIALGAKTSNSVSLNSDKKNIESIVASNALVKQRLSSSQLSMNLMADSAQQMLKAFISVNDSNDANRLAINKREVQSALGGFMTAANSSANGEYLFSGINTNLKPVNDYTAPGSPAKAAFDTAFFTKFGFSQNDPAAATITVAQMDDFISNTLEPSFTGADWKTNWSNASDTNISSRIRTNEVVDSSTNANGDGMRKFALAAVIGLELMNAPISDEVRKAVNSKAIDYAGQAVTGIDTERAKLGVSENRVSKANDALKSQLDIIKLNIGDVEGVDAYEASTRMKALLAQVETSYKLTANIQKLSLMNYL